MWNRNNRLHTNNKKHVYKEGKETTHERVGERKTYINNIEVKISTMYVYNGHKTSCKRTTLRVTTLISKTPPNTMT